MYGIDADLPIEFFINATLEQIALGLNIIQFRFSPEGYIGVEGDWRLDDPTGIAIDNQLPNAQREHYQVHKILGQAVTRYKIIPPKQLILYFSNDHVLHIFDSSEQYESFSIQPGNIFI